MEQLLTRSQAEAVLRRNEIGRLACFSPSADESCLVPISYRYHKGSVYFAMLPGRKLDYLYEHPAGVCLEVDEVDGHDDWTTVLITGTFTELTGQEEIEEGMEAVKRVARGPLRALFETRMTSPGPLTLGALRPAAISGRRNHWDAVAHEATAV